MKNLKIFTVAVFIVFLGCSDSDDTKVTNPIPTNDSFLPMSIGNYWKHDKDNITKITDTLRIQGDLYYRFESLIGGDIYINRYLRIDEDQNLLEVNPDAPDFKITITKFNIALNDTFGSLDNIEKWTLIKKEDNLRTYECLNFAFNDVIKYYTSYTRGLGWKNYPGMKEIIFKQIKIDGVLYMF